MTEQTHTLSQYKATAKFHRRVERAYRETGQEKNAEAARKAAEALEAKVKELEQK